MIWSNRLFNLVYISEFNIISQVSVINQTKYNIAQNLYRNSLFQQNYFDFSLSINQFSISDLLEMKILSKLLTEPIVKSRVLLRPLLDHTTAPDREAPPLGSFS